MHKWSQRFRGERESGGGAVVIPLKLEYLIFLAKDHPGPTQDDIALRVNSSTTDWEVLPQTSLRLTITIVSHDIIK